MEKALRFGLALLFAMGLALPSAAQSGMSADGRRLQAVEVFTSDGAPVTPTTPMPTGDRLRAQPEAEQTSTVTASQTWQGTSRNAGVANGSASPWAYYFSQILSASAAGTQYVKCSSASNFSPSRTVASQAIAASSAGNAPLKVIRPSQYCRTEFLAGGSNSDIVVADGFLGQ